jgi:coenzyme Q-binding protein COQ10
MPALAYNKILPFSKKQLFDLVIDVDAYKEFLPNCHDSIVISRSEDLIIADLTLEFSHFRETYRSVVQFEPNNFITTKAMSGPFKYLHSHWKFEEYSVSETFISFSIDFELKMSLFTMIINMVLEDSARKMLAAFEKRAREVYVRK